MTDFAIGATFFVIASSWFAIARVLATSTREEAAPGLSRLPDTPRRPT